MRPPPLSGSVCELIFSECALILLAGCEVPREQLGSAVFCPTRQWSLDLE